MGRRGRFSALRDQRAELRPLQDLRYQGPESEYHLGSARRRRRSELSKYVIDPSRLSHTTTFNGVSPVPDPSAACVPGRAAANRPVSLDTCGRAAGAPPEESTKP